MMSKTKLRGRLFRNLVLPVGLAIAFLGYLTSELVLEGRWINKLVFEDNWAESIRIASFAIAAVLIWFVSRLRYSEYQQSVEYALRYDSILEKSPNGMIVLRDGWILFVNSSARKILGFDERLHSESKIWYLDFVDPRDRERVTGLASQRTRERPVDLQYDCRFVGKDGNVVWAQVSSFVIQYGGHPAVLINISDITEGKLAEEQLVHSTRLAELGEMAAGVAHELNQPLTGIRNFADSAAYMLENDVGDSSDVVDNLVLIREQVDRASRIINQMQDLSRRSERKFEILELNGLVEECIDFLSHQLMLSGVNTVVKLGEQMPPIKGDRIRLIQVLLNILTNARQAMEEVEQRDLEVVTTWDEDKGVVIVRISDSGPGFTTDQASKIFSPFFSTKKSGHGTGLGLSISQTIVEEHDGWIDSESTSGNGAIFTIFLPAFSEQSSGYGGDDGKE